MRLSTQEWGRGRGRGRSRLPPTPSTETEAELGLRALGSRLELKADKLNWLSHPGAPKSINKFYRD